MSTRILAIEDSPTQAEALRLLLESRGYVVTLAPSGEEALRLMPAAECDLVVSDIVMPGMDGYELCRRLKSDPARGSLPVILLTSLGDPMDIIRGLDCGADNYIIKPYEPEHLLARIRHVLDTRARRRLGQPQPGVEISFLGKTFTITSGKEQTLDFLISTFEDIVRTNEKLERSRAELTEAHARLEVYARQMAVQARGSAEKYWALMQQASDAVFALDPAGKILEANARATELVGVRLDDLRGRRFQDLLLPDEVEYVQVQLSKLPSMRRFEGADLHLRHADGHLVCADMTASFVPGEAHPLVFAIVHDVTQRNRLERQVMEQEKLAMVGQLAAGVAHEINNPMTYVLANLEQLEESTQPVLRAVAALRSWAEERVSRDARAEFLRIMEENGLDRVVAQLLDSVHDAAEGAKRIRDIVRDLKTLAHHSEEETVARVNVNSVLESAINIAFNEIKYRATVERDLDELPEIVASPGRLTQVFLNLLINAAQAIETGNPAGNRIRVISRHEGQWLRIDVEDTGKGIPPEVRPRIFQPFFTTKPVGTGTGLGLSISLGIVRDLGGNITLATAVGQGTTFTVLLPVHTGRQVVDQETPAPVAPAAHRILLVDDESYVLRAYTRVLGRHHELTTALGGREAIAVLNRSGGKFDAMVCDLMMPDVDGIDLHAYVKEHFPGLEPRMVFVTGGAVTLRARDFLASLSTPWLEKPFEMDELVRRIAEVANQPVT